MSKPVVITIDGPAAAGKGTLARRLAEYFDFAYLDTGSIYRAVGLKTLRAGGQPTDIVVATRSAETLTAEEFGALLLDPELRADATADAASKVAAVPGVRAALLAFQRGFAARPPGGKPGAVLDGRDAGTVICPDAPIKLFVTASVEARANRRFKELQGRGEAAISSAVLQDLQARDAKDRDRGIAPLKPAEDAYRLDSTALDADGVFKTALSYVLPRL